MISKFFNLPNNREQVSYRYQNPQALEVKIEHQGNSFTQECLQNITQILSTGNSNGSYIGEIFELVNSYQQISTRESLSVSQQLETITYDIKQKVRDIQNTQMPSEFSEFQKIICKWLIWHQEYFINITLMTKGQSFTPKLFNSPLTSLKENIKQDIQEAVEQGELISPNQLCKKAKKIMAIHDISLTVEPCY